MTTRMPALSSSSKNTLAALGCKVMGEEAPITDDHAERYRAR